MHPAQPVSIETDAGDLWDGPPDGPLVRFARLAEPHLARVDAALRRFRSGYPAEGPRDARTHKALLSITPGAAARLLPPAGRPPISSSRSPTTAAAWPSLTSRPGRWWTPCATTTANSIACWPVAPAEHAALQAVRQQLHFRTLLAVNNAYYQVREAETQAFYGLLRAEMDATGLDDLLHRFIVILTRTFRAQAGRMIPLTDRPPIAARVLKRLARPRYIAAGSRG